MDMDLHCSCGHRVALKTSWTGLNPGRRFYACAKEKKKCDFFSWFDEPMCERSRQIIPGLLKRMNKYEETISRQKKKQMWMWVGLLVSWMLIVILIIQ